MLLCGGRDAGQLPTGSDDVALLVRARSGDSAAREAVSETVGRNALVRHVAQLDPRLGGGVR